MNRLADQTSPYLRQHRDNPVDWFPWGPEAFAEAERRNVPILLSIGYSACHWCHVMAHECFEDADVAASMNTKFVNVKVDREERPDVDAIYMDALQALTGRGGWPLTMFLTPSGEPFFGGTYYPRAQFLQLLDAVDQVYRDKPGDVDKNVGALRKAIDRTAGLTAGSALPTIEQVNAGVQAIARALDKEWGGFGKEPKFPSTFNIELMLRALVSSGSEYARDAVTTTLDAMASGGIYDHVGGGFARYSVDREWRVPHFEKMLYDQALLARVYLHGFMVLGRPQWRLVLEETIGYVLTRLRDERGGLYSAEDADSPDAGGHGVEGLFHTWTPVEAREALGDLDPRLVAATLDWFDITEQGNFESRSIPNRIAARGALVRPPEIEAARRRLFTAREQRRRPGLDDKVLTEWNALFLSTLSEAAAVFGRSDWLDAAIGIAEFLVTELRDERGRWLRSWHRDATPHAHHAALAADHANLVDAFTRLAEASGQARWIDEAVRTAETMLEWFWDPVEGGLYTTADDAEALIVRQKDLDDNATPSANSTAAIALLRLAALTGELRYRNHAERILQLMQPQLGKAGMYSNSLIAADLAIRGLTEVVITGDRADLVTVAQRIWRPDKVLAWGERFDSPLWEGRADGLAYVCRDFTCRAPVGEVDDLVEALTGRRPNSAGTA